MPTSIRLGRDMEKKLNEAKDMLNMSKTEIIRRSLNEFLSKVFTLKRPYKVYKTLLPQIPGSGKGNLSVASPKEVRKRIKGN